MSVINPKTNRSVKTDSKTYKKLLKEFDYDETKRILIPKDKNKYQYSKNKNQYVLKSKLSNKFDKTSDNVKLKDDYIKAPTGRIIKKNGTAYKKFIKNGYTVLNDIFIKPTNIKTFKAEFQNLNKDNFKNTKIITLTIPQINEEYIYYYKNYKDFQQWFRVIFYPYEDTDYDVNLNLYETNDKIKFGVAYDGTQNCVIESVKTHMNNIKTNHPMTKKEEQYILDCFSEYEEGVFDDDYNNIANKFRLYIKLHVYGKIYEYGKQEYKKNRPILNLIYHNNHVEILNKTIEPEKEIIKFENKECNCLDNLSFDTDFKHTCHLEYQLEQIDLSTIINLKFNCYKKLIGIFTTDKIYKYSHDRGINSNELIELKDKEYSLSDKVSNEIMDYFTEKPQCINSDLEITKQLCYNQIFYNNQILKANEKYKLLDIKNAYDNFGELPTDLLIRIDTNKLHKELGFYYITYNCPIRNVNISEWRFTEYLKTLQKHNIKFTIQQAMLSSGKTILDINKLNSIYKHHDKRFFHILLGKWQVYEFNKNIITTDYEICRKLGGITINVCNQELYICPNEKFQSTKNYYPHIVGAIHEYTNSKILDTILTYKLQPLRIWVDGIILNEYSKHECSSRVGYPKKYPDYFREETKIYKTDQNPELIYDNHDKLCPDNTYNYVHLLPNKLSAVLGKAGTGKSTYIREIANNIPNTQILVPSKSLLKDYQDCKYVMTYQRFISPNTQLSQHDIILVDEMSMVNNFDLNTIIKKANCKVIIFGDTRQLPCINGQPIDVNKIQTMYFLEVHRQKDEEFINLLDYTYNNTSVDYINQKFSVEYCINNNILILSPIKSEIKRINKIGYQNNKSKKIDDNFKVNMPIICKKEIKTKEIYNGEIGRIVNFDGKIVSINLYDTIYEITVKQLNNHFDLCYSTTYHKIQGKTIEKGSNICLNLKGLQYFDCQKEMLYVGVSRVRKIEQLSILD